MAIDKYRDIIEREEPFSPLEDDLEISPEELQDLYQSIGVEQAELLIQEFKELKRSGFQGGFREFLQLKIKTAQGPGRPEEMITEEEMQIGPGDREMIDIQQQIGAPTTGAEAAAYGGRMGYRQAGPVLPPTPGPPLPPTPADEPLLTEMGGIGSLASAPTPESEWGDLYEDYKYDQRKQGLPILSFEDWKIDYFEGDYLGARGGRVGYQRGALANGGSDIGWGEPDHMGTPDYFPPLGREETGMYDAADDQSFPWQRIFAWLKERGEEFTWENIQKAIRAIGSDVQLGSPEEAQGQGIGSLMAPGEEIIEEGVEEIIPEAGRLGRQGLQPRATPIMPSIPQPFGQNILPQPKPAITEDPNIQYDWANRPQQWSPTQLAKHGGRIGYDDGGPTKDPQPTKDSFAIKIFKKPYHQLTSAQQIEIDGFFPKLLEHKAHGGRIGYGIGSFVSGLVGGVADVGKSLVKSVKKFAKTDIGKLAMMYVAGSYLAGAGTGQTFMQRMAPGQFMTNLGFGATPAIGAGQSVTGPAVMGPLGNYNVTPDMLKMGYGAGATSPGISFASGAPQLGYAGTATGTLGAGTTTGLGTAAASTSGYVPGEFLAALGPAAEKAVPWYKDPWKVIPGAMLGSGYYAQQNPGETLESAMEGRDEDVAEWDRLFAAVKKDPAAYSQFAKDITFPYPNYQRGGRVAAQEGGLMNLGGLEKDYRNDGGFVPLGKKEKADDVPARLSKNEFVMTADAVKNAGDGDVDLGAERMKNVMKNLEEGGSLSEQSQGLEGAREMFEVSERLSEVV
jgi:hypothetical protein